MKRLSDYKDEEALDLWADLLEPATKILSDKAVTDCINAGIPRILIARNILKAHKKEANEILLRIDPEPLNGLNIVIRLVNLLVELGENEDIRTFFVSAGEVKTLNGSSGSPTESTEEREA